MVYMVPSRFSDKHLLPSRQFRFGNIGYNVSTQPWKKYPGKKMCVGTYAPTHAFFSVLSSYKPKPE